MAVLIDSQLPLTLFYPPLAHDFRPQSLGRKYTSSVWSRLLLSLVLSPFIRVCQVSTSEAPVLHAPMLMLIMLAIFVSVPFRSLSVVKCGATFFFFYVTSTDGDESDEERVGGRVAPRLQVVRAGV